jgi:hypothetical protein
MRAFLHLVVPAVGFAVLALIPTVAARPQAAGPWRTLFDGTSVAAWRGYRMDAAPAGWRIVDGTLAKEDKTVDLVTREQFGDFELALDWKIGRAGNSGILYRGTEQFDHIYQTAPEYQLLDDIDAADNKTRHHCAGSLYDMIDAPVGHLHPVGGWNQTRIVAKGPHVEHWLNGAKLLEYELGSEDWKARLAASKFSKSAAFAEFGKYTRGHIAFQGDHDGSLAFRNIRIRELK